MTKLNSVTWFAHQTAIRCRSLRCLLTYFYIGSAGSSLAPCLADDAQSMRHCLVPVKMGNWCQGDPVEESGSRHHGTVARKDEADTELRKSQRN
jgi:hypothetical protein